MTFQLDPGELREQLQLHSRGAPTKDAHGQAAYAWPLTATVWGKYVPMKSGERFAAAQMQQDTTVRFFIRERSDVNASWRLTWAGVKYDIVAATSMPGRQWMELICRQGVKDGR